MWLYKNKVVIEAPQDIYGFVYKITNLSDGRIYIGKKCFSFSVKKKLSKRVKKASGTRRTIERVAKDSGWQKYYGSSLTLKADVSSLGESNFKREILHYCVNKSILSYMEVVEQINHEVLLKESYNSWISCKIYKTHLK